FFAKTASMGPVGPGLKSGQIVNLATLRDPAPLERVLTPVVDTELERRYIAQALFERVHGEAVDDVDALAALRVPADELAAPTALGELRERARAALAAATARDSGRAAARTAKDAPRVTVLSTAQFRELRDALIVRTPGQFRGALFAHALLFLLAFAAMHVL